jgi:hypothetical protein
MALPKTLEPSLTPDELTFLAEDEHIQVVPLFSMGKIRLLSVSSFRPARYVTCHDTLSTDRRGGLLMSGHLWSISAPISLLCSTMARLELETETQMQDSHAGVADSG